MIGYRCVVTAIGLLAMLAGEVAAQTYTVKVDATLNGLDVKVETVEHPGMLVVNLRNDSGMKVRCNLKFDASPQSLYRTTVFLDPGEKGAGTFRARQHWFQVNVDVACEAVKDK